MKKKIVLTKLLLIPNLFWLNFAGRKTKKKRDAKQKEIIFLAKKKGPLSNYDYRRLIGPQWNIERGPMRNGVLRVKFTNDVLILSQICIIFITFLNDKFYQFNKWIMKYCFDKKKYFLTTLISITSIKKHMFNFR